MKKIKIIISMLLIILLLFRIGTEVFGMFPTVVIVLVVNEHGEAALLRQRYISAKYNNLVSGYMKPGETAEQTARREVSEEIGIEMTDLRLVGTYWNSQKDLLMIGFIGHADKEELTLSWEVDAAEWIPAEDAIKLSTHREARRMHSWKSI